MSMIGVDYGVLNQKGSPSWFSDIYANIPTAGYKGRMFISTDTFAFYRDTGTGWDLIGGPGTGTITGSGASGQVSYFNGSSTLAGSNNLFWDSTNNRLGIGTATPSAPLDIHSTGTNAQFNGTGTNNAYLVFQNSGTSKWRIGNTYNAGANSFDIYNNGLANTPLSINSATNLITLSANVTTTGIQAVQNGLNLGYASGGATSLYTNIYGSTTGINFALANGTGGASFIFQTAASYNYTFPATTGTLALTSNLSSYVPYSGATGSVNLGNYDLTVYGLTIGRGGGSVATNTALGYQALNNGTGTQNDQNTAIGYRSLYSNTLGQYNTALGYFSLYNNNSSSNTAIGWYSLYTNTGMDNTGTGYRSLYLNSSGASNTAFGRSALDQNSTGSNNTAIGMFAGYGTGTNYNTTGSNNIFIGYQSVGVSSTASNRTFIGNSSTTSTWLGGNLLIGTTTDSGYNLQVTGTGIISQLYINPTNTAITGLDVASDNISFRSDNLEGFKRQLLITMGSGTLIQFTAQGYGANYGTDLAFYTATTSGVNASPGIYITGTNNRVGIKTGTPSYDLDVTGTFRVTSTATFNSTINITAGTNVNFGTTDTGALFLRSNNINNVTLFSSGNTAIYSSSDTGERFQVTGTARINGIINVISAGSTQLFLSSSGASSRNWQFQTSESANGDLSIMQSTAAGGASYVTKLNISPTGNVNIGGSIRDIWSLEVIKNSSATGAGGYPAVVVNNSDAAGYSAFYLFQGSTNKAGLEYNNAANQLSITSGGTYKLSALGTGTVTATSGVLSVVSDMNLKIEDGFIDNALDKVLKLIPRYFYWKKESGLPTDIRQLGFYAQEVNLALGEESANTPKNEADTWGIYDRGMIAMLTKAIQELNEKLVKNNIN